MKESKLPAGIKHKCSSVSNAHQEIQDQQKNHSVHGFQVAYNSRIRKEGAGNFRRDYYYYCFTILAIVATIVLSCFCYYSYGTAIGSASVIFTTFCRQIQGLLQT